MSGGEPVGLVGAGQLGAAVARRLLRAGVRLHVHNRDPRKVEPLVRLGAEAAPSPAGVAARCRTVLVCVTGGPAVEAVCCGPGGVAEGAGTGSAGAGTASAGAGTVVVDLSTTGPAAAVALHARLRAQGVDYVECPVSGGPDGAAAGTLTALLAGDDRACRAVDALVALFAGDRRYLGGPGRAQLAKVVNNALESIHLAAAAEIAGLATAHGLDLDELRWVLAHARGGSVYAHVVLDYLTGAGGGSGATLGIRRKDVRLALDSAPGDGATPLLRCTDDVLARSERRSGAGADQCECARLYVAAEVPRTAGGREG